MPGADNAFWVTFIFETAFCSLYCDPVTLCVKLFSSHFCSEEVDELRLVLGLDSFSVHNPCVPLPLPLPFPRYFHRSVMFWVVHFVQKIKEFMSRLGQV